MKTALIFLVVAILILLLLWFRTDVWFTNATVDIHFHDTYFVSTRFSFVVFVILFLGTLSSLGGIIGTRFRNKFFLFAFIIFSAADGYLIWNIYSSFPGCILGNFS